MEHRGQVEAELVVSQVERIAVLHLDVLGSAGAVEALYHLERLRVAHEADVGIVAADESQRARVVGLHVVDDEVVHGAVADHAADFLDVFAEEGHVHRINEGHALRVFDEIGIVRNALRQKPQALEAVLHAVVHSYIVYLAFDVHSL